MRPWSLRFALLVVAVALSCRESARLPPVQGPPLQVPEARSRAQMHGPSDRTLRVEFFSPQGELRSPHVQITATFNKPMVALDRVEVRTQNPVLQISPFVEGHQRWLGSRTLTFVPSRPLAGSTDYTLRLPSGVKALDGTALEKTVEWHFRTPCLEVSRVEPSRGAKWARPDTTVTLAFNQAVDPQRLAKHASFSVQRQSGDRSPFVLGARIEVGCLFHQ